MGIFTRNIILFTRNFSTASFLWNKTLGQQYGILSKLLKKPRKQSTNSKIRSPSRGGDLIGFDKLVPAREVRRQHVLNALLMEHITDLMTTEEIGNDIRDRGIEILRVKVSSDFTFANVYWFATDNSVDVDLQALLDNKSFRLRSMLIGLHVLGNVPQIKFVRDNQYSVSHRALKLIEKIEVQRREDIADQYKEIPTIYQAIANDDDIEVINENIQSDMTMPLPPMMRNIYGLDYEYLMNKVIERSKKVKRQKTQAEKNVSKYATKGAETIPFIATNQKFLTLLKKKKLLSKIKKADHKQTTNQYEYEIPIAEVEDEDFYDEESTDDDYNKTN